MLKVNLLPLFFCLIFYYHYSKVFAKAKYPPPPSQSLSQFPKLEATRSITTPPWMGYQYTSPLQGDALSFIAFHQTSLVTCQYTFLLGGDWHCVSEVFCPRTQHIDPAKSQTQTSLPRVQCTNHKTTVPSKQVSILIFFTTFFFLFPGRKMKMQWRQL